MPITSVEPTYVTDLGKAYVLENVPMPHRKITAPPFVAVIEYANGKEKWVDYDLYTRHSAEAWCRQQLGIKTVAQLEAEKIDAKEDEKRRIRILQGKGTNEDARTILSQLEGAEYELARLREMR